MQITIMKYIKLFLFCLALCFCVTPAYPLIVMPPVGATQTIEKNHPTSMLQLLVTPEGLPTPTGQQYLAWEKSRVKVIAWSCFFWFLPASTFASTCFRKAQACGWSKHRFNIGFLVSSVVAIPLLCIFNVEAYNWVQINSSPVSYLLQVVLDNASLHR